MKRPKLPHLLKDKKEVHFSELKLVNWHRFYKEPAGYTEL